MCLSLAFAAEDNKRKKHNVSVRLSLSVLCIGCAMTTIAPFEDHTAFKPKDSYMFVIVFDFA